MCSLVCLSLRILPFSVGWMALVLLFLLGVRFFITVVVAVVFAVVVAAVVDFPPPGAIRLFFRERELR